MTDIVERLRRLAERERPYGSLPDTLEEAAAEIERLREWNAEIALNAREFAAENERLRAALKDARVSVEGWADYASDYIKEKWDLKGDLARIDAALEGK